jgi:PhzF family phenazine biosynthesis protein
MMASGVPQWTGKRGDDGVVTSWRFFHVDAFTTVPFAGNPAAVLLADRDLDDDLGQRLGAELSQPATAVVWPAGEPGHFGLRWFTATAELGLCGHGTLAAARVLFDVGLAAGGQLHFTTRGGQLSAQIAGDWIQLRFPALRPVPLADQFLGGQIRDLLAVPVTELLRNSLDVIAVLSSPAEVRYARPDLLALRRLPVHGLVITARGDDQGADFVSRFFSPATGIPEDAVTGSAHCALGPYWISRLHRQPLTGRQLSARGGLVHVEQEEDSVLLTGSAIVLADGSWHPPPG